MNVPTECFEEILKYTDLFLYDVKAVSSQTHMRYTGVDNSLILHNLRFLSQDNAHIWIRIPVIHNVNDTAEEMDAISDLLKEISYEKVELLPYHKLGQSKSRALGVKEESLEPPDKNMVKLMTDRMNAH